MKTTFAESFPMCCVALAVWMGIAWQAVAAQPFAGNARQAVGNSVFFGQYPQTFLGCTQGKHYVPQPSVPYVLKQDHRHRDGQNPPQPYHSYFLLEPVTWRVLAENAQGLLLVADRILDGRPYHSSAFAATWSGSTLRAWLETGFFNGSTATPVQTDFFPADEKNAVVLSSVANPTVGFGKDPDGITTQDHVFLLAAADSVFFGGAADRQGFNTDYAASYENTADPWSVADSWLLRTHSAGPFAGYISYVQADGFVNTFDGLKDNLPGRIRPALHLSKDVVVLVSDANKPAWSPGAPLTAVSASASGTLKLTLVGGGLTLGSSDDGTYKNTAAGSTLSLNYAGLSAGSGRYISCVLEQQDGNILYYSKIADAATASGTVNIPVPLGLANGAYVLKLFCEEPSAGMQTPDRASRPAVIHLGIGPATAPQIGTAALPEGWEGVAYDTPLTLSGMPAPALSVSSGSLPPGLALEAGGRIHGTPSSTGTFLFEVTAVNGGGSDTKSYTVTVHSPIAPSITAPPAGALPDGTLGIPLAPVSLTVTGTPAPALSVISGKLPEGLAFDPATGVISGTPAKAEYATFTIQAGNALGVDSKTWSMTVRSTGPAVAPKITTLADTLPVAYVNIPYDFKIEATGTPAPVFDLNVPLPAGLSLDVTAGKIHGTPLLPAAGTYTTFTVTARNGNSPDDARTYVLPVAYTLNPPALTLTPPIIVTGSDPFGMTATFDVPVSGLTAADVTVNGGTVSGMTMSGPSGTPARTDVWTFDVTPDPALPDGRVMEIFVRKGAAKDEHGAATYRESDTTRIAYHTDRPVIRFSLTDGMVFLAGMEEFFIDIFPYGTGADADRFFVNGAAADRVNVAGLLEIYRNGTLYTGWDLDLRDTRATVTGYFGQGDYTLLFRGDRLTNNAGKQAVQRTLRFAIQVSKNRYEGCRQSFSRTFPVSASDRRITIAYAGLSDYLVAPDGGSLPWQMILPAGETELTFTFGTRAVPPELEGNSVDIVIAPDGLSAATYRFRLYNRPKAEDVVYMPVTTLYPGYFKLLRGGSPWLQRSLDGGLHWSGAWSPASTLELADAGKEILFREPDGCETTVISLETGIDVTIRRQVILPEVKHVETSPAAGLYSLYSGSDFVFRVKPTGPYAGMKPMVTTDRQVPDSIGVIVERAGDGSYEVRIRAIRETVHISLQTLSMIGNAGVEAARVWASGGQLYIASLRDDEAKVYTLSGMLLKSVPVMAGKTVQTSLPHGIHIVRLGCGSVFKVNGYF
ncbi:MAG: putative Ig domain-containing protein [Tannerella sp.]|nr:putative Ig domain-containing protein [Tannerella sp.]